MFAFRLNLLNLTFARGKKKAASVASSHPRKNCICCLNQDALTSTLELPLKFSLDLKFNWKESQIPEAHMAIMWPRRFVSNEELSGFHGLSGRKEPVKEI